MTRRMHLWAAIMVAGCAAAAGSTSGQPDASTESGSGGAVHDGSTDADSTTIDASAPDVDAPPCNFKCSSDLRSLLDCTDNVIKTCEGSTGCDILTGECIDACTASENNRQSIGCEYFATFADTYRQVSGLAQEKCFAAVVSNTWSTPAQLSVEWDGAALNLESFARVPTGPGPFPTLLPYDATAGLAPGASVLLFLSGPNISSQAPCPVQAAVPEGVALYDQTGVGKSFRISSDVPVVAHQINPYGDGKSGISASGISGASLLIPTSAWGDNYIAVTAAPFEVAKPSMNIIARYDQTTVTLLPTVAVEGGGAIPSSPANVPVTFTLERGEHAQFTQQADLIGSIVAADKPIGFLAGHQCMQMPAGVGWCDHAEQMIPPINALGSEYVAVAHRPRTPGDPSVYKLVGVEDGTLLTWEGATGPSVLNRGQVANVMTSDPFIVRSQGQGHPFLLFIHMTGAEMISVSPPLYGQGDPDFVLAVPPSQFLSSYVFFADPTFPETNLVVVRAKAGGKFQPVQLDCLGELTGWNSLGEYEWTRVDLTTGNYQPVGSCASGRREMHSSAPFGVWVWGWGTANTPTNSKWVSYGFPAGMSITPVNTLSVPVR